ncbi:Cytochrome b561 and DOMON domain-containing protein [Drosera capensis]
MPGSQAFLAYTNSSSINLKLYNISSYSEILETEDLGVKVYERKAEWIRGVGPGMTNGRPIKHEFAPANLASVGKLSLTDSGAGETPAGGGGGGLGMRKRNVHGILNAVSWGILFPVGAIIARYLGTFPSADPAWFYLHASCQVSAYAIGVAGWATGLKLGSENCFQEPSLHWNRSLLPGHCTDFCVVHKAEEGEHKLRLYWNIYHHSIGYAIIILGVINFCKGLSILNPEHKWKLAYTTVLIALGGISALLEVIGYDQTSTHDTYILEACNATSKSP